MGCIGRDGGRGREGRRTSDGALRAVGSNASGCAGAARPAVEGGREVTAAQFRERESEGVEGEGGWRKGCGKEGDKPDRTSVIGN